MTAENASVVLEVTRQVANMAQQGLYNIAVAKLADVARADEEMYKAVTKNLSAYLLQGDLDDLLAVVEMVK